MNKQQKQTKLFFEKDAINWSKKSFFPKNNKLLNTIHERNIYVINLIKKKKLLYHLDVGCGVGDLVFNSSKITNKDEWDAKIEYRDNEYFSKTKKFIQKKLSFIENFKFLRKILRLILYKNPFFNVYERIKILKIFKELN